MARKRQHFGYSQLMPTSGKLKLAPSPTCGIMDSRPSSVFVFKVPSLPAKISKRQKLPPSDYIPFKTDLLGHKHFCHCSQECCFLCQTNLAIYDCRYIELMKEQDHETPYIGTWWEVGEFDEPITSSGQTVDEFNDAMKEWIAIVDQD